MYMYSRQSIKNGHSRYITFYTNYQNKKRRQVCVCTTGTAREKPEQRRTWVSFTSTGCSLAPLSMVVLRRG